MISKVLISFGLLAVLLGVYADDVSVISQESDISPDGSFKWSYESSDGSKQDQTGRLEGAVLPPLLKFIIQCEGADCTTNVPTSTTTSKPSGSGDGDEDKDGGSGTNSAVEVSGSATWVDPEGNPHYFQYLAGKNGYQPVGDDIPVAPEIPADIARALDWIASHPQAE